MNSVNLIGRITEDPELRTTNTHNISVCNFTLAVDKTYTVKEGEKNAEFIDCVAWGKIAENLVANQKKGWIIGLSGKLKNTIKKKNEVEYQTLIVDVTEINFTKWDNTFNNQD